MPQRVLAMLVIASGANALLVEQAFEKMLGTVVGSSTPAASIVLAIYFAGLALGGLVYPRLRARIGSPLRTYAVVEGLVGAYALLLGALLAPLQLVSMKAIQLAGLDAVAVWCARITVAALWVLPPTVLLGASFPAVVGALKDELLVTAPRSIARFYAWNMVGAAAGALAIPYLVFSYLGLSGGLFASAALQLAVVASALALRRRLPAVLASPASSAPFAAQARELLGATSGRRLALVAFSSGFVVFACEVVWLHLMGVTLGMSVFQFGDLLFVVLVSLSLGAAMVSWIRPGAAAVSCGALPVVLCVAAALLVLTSRGWDDVPMWLLGAGRDVHTFARGELVRGALAMRVIAPPCIALGMVYPLVFRDEAFPMGAADRVAGALGAVNALGCVTGSLVVTFALLPGIGSEGTCYALALLLVLIALAVAVAAARPERRLLAAALPLLCAPVVAWAGGASPWNRAQLTSGTNVYFGWAFVGPDAELRFWHEDAQGGVTTVVDVPTAAAPVRVLLTNGKFQGNDGDEIPAQTGFALVPLAVTPGRERALVIGAGTGYSAHVLWSAGVHDVEVAEIAEGIVAAARGPMARLNHDVLGRPNVEVHLEDGRNHLLRTSQRYDIITIEITSVWFAGAGNLYTREFYEIAAAHLRPHGVLQQWIQLHHISIDEVASALAALRSVFPHVALWVIGGQGVTTASFDPLEPSAAAIAQLRGQEELAGLLAGFENEFGAIDELATAPLLDDAAVDRVVADAAARGVPVQSDANRYLEYWTPRHNLEPGDHRAENIRLLKATSGR